MAEQSAKNPGMSRSDMTKACNEQMKMHKNHADMSKTPAGATNDSDPASTTSSPK